MSKDHVHIAISAFRMKERVMSVSIKSIKTTAGYLQDCPIEFSSGLNCIIGARGTCKSTLVETIRYVFNHDEKKILTLMGDGGKEGEPTYGIIPATLGAGSAHCCVEVVEGGDTNLYNLERETGADTRIYQEGVREHSKPDILYNIEIFSQGDLQRIAEDNNGSLRISLIDRPNAIEIKNLGSQRGQLTKTLTNLGDEIRSLRVNLQSVKQQFQPLVNLVQQLDEIKKSCPKLSPELELQRKHYEQRELIISELKKVVGIQTEIIPILPTIQGHLQQINNILSFLQSVPDEGIEGSVKIIDVFSKNVKDVALSLHSLANQQINEEVLALTKIFDDRNEIFYSLRKEEQEANESLKKQLLLKKQIEHLEKLRKEFDEGKSKEKQLLLDRDKIRSEISVIDNKIFNMRMKEIESINTEFGDSIFLTLTSDTATSGYTHRLMHILTGSRIRGQDEVAISIAKSFPPAKLIDLAESGEAQILAEVLDRDLGQMTRVVAHLADHPELYTLETENPASVLDITMYQDGHPKPVESLSKGQKATALLPLILRPLPYPLLFDQPEDDLDNSFIYASLVKAIHELKLKRQLLFVTHNANIPVLGDADRVIVMKMSSPRNAGVPQIGTVDDQKKEILDLLEGGAKAFLDRETRYGMALKGE